MLRRGRPRSPAEQEEIRGLWRAVGLMVAAVVLCGAVLVLFVEFL